MHTFPFEDVSFGPAEIEAEPKILLLFFEILSDIQQLLIRPEMHLMHHSDKILSDL